MLKNANLSSGAHPAVTFPNCHLLKSPILSYPAFSSKDSVSSQGSTPSQVSQVSVECNATWSAPVEANLQSELREAVQTENWEVLFAEGKTVTRVNPAWCASQERASALRCLASLARARNLLELGACCGVATLALAEALPRSRITAVELDDYLVDFARRFITRSEAKQRIRLLAGSATSQLQQLACAPQPFDFVVIDADKHSMMEYFNMLWNTPGMLSEKAVICVDMTPFKGQPPKRYVRFGQEDKWESPSGETQINSFREYAQQLPQVDVNEFEGLLVVRKRG